MKKVLVRVADCKINLWANEYLRQLYDSNAIYDMEKLELIKSILSKALELENEYEDEMSEKQKYILDKAINSLFDLKESVLDELTKKTK